VRRRPLRALSLVIVRRDPSSGSRWARPGSCGHLPQDDRRPRAPLGGAVCSGGTVAGRALGASSRYRAHVLLEDQQQSCAAPAVAALPGQMASTACVNGASQAGHSSASAGAFSPQFGHITFKGRLQEGQRSSAASSTSAPQLGQVACMDQSSSPCGATLKRGSERGSPRRTPVSPDLCARSSSRPSPAPHPSPVRRTRSGSGRGCGSRPAGAR